MNGKTKSRTKGCYVANQHCCNELTREHVISKSILIELQPTTWTFGDLKVKIGINSAVLRYLCKHHNNALSDYDAEALKFVASWNKIKSRLPDRSGFVKYDHFDTASMRDSGTPLKLEAIKIDTKKFELWMLKTFFNLIVFHARLDEQLKPFRRPDIITMSKYLFDNHPVEPPFGVYQIPIDKKLSKKFGWSFQPVFQDLFHQSNETGMITHLITPTIMYMRFGVSELVGFFNLTGFSDKQALDGPLKHWKETLTSIGKYRTDINIYGTKVREKGDSIDVLRGIKFV